MEFDVIFRLVAVDLIFIDKNFTLKNNQAIYLGISVVKGGPILAAHSAEVKNYF